MSVCNLRTKVAHLGDAYEQIQPHGAKEYRALCVGRHGGVAGRGAAERGRGPRQVGCAPLCVGEAIHDAIAAQARHVERRGAETGVVQAAWCGGRGAAGRLAAAARAPQL